MADPFNVSASIVAFLQLSVTVVKYLSNVKDAPDDIKYLLVEISSIKGLLSILHDFTQSGETWLATVQSLNVQNGFLEQFRSALERLEEKLASVVGLSKAIKALAWPFQKEEVKDILCRIERQKTFFSLVLQNDHL
jgi:hypothetical protein